MSAVTQTLMWLAIPLLGVVIINAILLGIEELKVRAAFASGRADPNDSTNFAGVNWMLVALKIKHAPMLVLLLGETLTIACTYSIARLITAMMREDGTGRTIADGRTFTSGELWANLTTYYTDESLALKATLIAALWIVLVNLAAMFHLRWAYRLLTIAVRPVMVLLMFAAIVIAIAGFAVWALAGPMENPNYNMGMVSLYVFWVVLLLAATVGISLTASIGDAIYALEE